VRDFLCRIAESAEPTLAHAERLEKIEMSRSKDAPNPFIRLDLAAGLSMWRCPEILAACGKVESGRDCAVPSESSRYSGAQVDPSSSNN
jgi:hypothetical protein